MMDDIYSSISTWGAPLLAFMIGMMRSVRDGKALGRSAIEGGMLACAAFGVVPVLHYVGLGTDAAWGVAVWMGYVGVDTIRRAIQKANILPRVKS